MGTRGTKYYHYSVMDDVSLLVIIYSYFIYLSIYLYQINFMFRYLFGVTETMGLNDVYGFVDP